MDLYDQATQDACSPAVLCPLLNQTLLFFFFTFIYFLLCWVFIALHGLSLVAVSGVYSSLQYTGFSLLWLLLFLTTGSGHMGFNGCSTQAR